MPFKILAWLKILRGTPFDLFGYTAERKMERNLIYWYEGLISILLKELPHYGVSRLLPIAAAPMDIRGYGPIKVKAAHDVRTHINALLGELTRDDESRGVP